MCSRVYRPGLVLFLFLVACGAPAAAPEPDPAEAPAAPGDERDTLRVAYEVI